MAAVAFTTHCWHINNGLLHCDTHTHTHRKQHRAAVLSLTMPLPNHLVSSCFDKKVREIDLRQPITVSVCHSDHTHSVLSVAASDR